MTYAEAILKYGDVEVTFNHYYKYVFTFVGECDGLTLHASLGGTDDIYRFELYSDGLKQKIKDLRPDDITAYKDGEEVWEVEEGEQ